MTGRAGAGVSGCRAGGGSERRGAGGVGRGEGGKKDGGGGGEGRVEGLHRSAYRNEGHESQLTVTG